MTSVKSDYLRRFASRRELGTFEIAGLTRSSVHTVAAWFKPETSISHREIPDGLLELLCLKLGARSPFTKAGKVRTR